MTNCVTNDYRPIKNRSGIRSVRMLDYCNYQFDLSHGILLEILVRDIGPSFVNRFHYSFDLVKVFSISRGRRIELE